MATKVNEPDRSHDNSGGNPGVLIYTSNKDTYNRYTATQSKDGQLPSAQVTYVGSPDSPNSHAFLATDNPVGIFPEFNGRTYGYRVTISPGEVWYYYSAKDAQRKQEEIALNQISAATIPHVTGFSAVAGAGGDAAASAIAAVVDVPPADAGIQWGPGIEAQGMPWEDYLAANKMPAGSRLPPKFKTFDFYDQASGTATSAKTLDTATGSKVTDSAELSKSLVKSIDAAADFTGASKGRTKLDPSQIKSRAIEVAIPVTTTPDQMEQINAAVRYGKGLGVTVNVTKTK
jgi:hypothetical protein